MIYTISTLTIINLALPGLLSKYKKINFYLHNDQNDVCFFSFFLIFLVYTVLYVQDDRNFEDVIFFLPIMLRPNNKHL